MQSLPPGREPLDGPILSIPFFLLKFQSQKKKKKGRFDTIITENYFETRVQEFSDLVDSLQPTMVDSWVDINGVPDQEGIGIVQKIGGTFFLLV